MGAIVSDFPLLPADADPDRAVRYAAIYADLASLGLALPAQPSNTITRAQLLAHLRALVGAIIKAELAADPDSVNYSGAADDNAVSQLLATSYVPAARRWPGSSNTGYKVAAGSTSSALVLSLNPGPGNPLFTTIPGIVAALVRFRAGAAVSVVANRSAIMPILLVTSDTTLALQAPLPAAPAVGDVCDIGFVLTTALPGRLYQVLAKIPHIPNLLTAADVAAAKT